MLLFKKKTTQTHKSCVILQSCRNSTDIRSLNNIKNSKISNSTPTIPNISPENFIKHSKDLRFALISTGQNLSPSILSTILKANQQSYIDLCSNSLIEFATQCQVNSTTVSTTPFKPILDKSSTINLLDIHQRFIKQEDTCNPIDSRYQTTSNNDYFKQFNNHNIINLYETEEDNENIRLVFDEEYEKNVQKAIVKCADWLIAYVFLIKHMKKNDE